MVEKVKLNKTTWKLMNRNKRQGLHTSCITNRGQEQRWHGPKTSCLGQTSRGARRGSIRVDGLRRCRAPWWRCLGERSWATARDSQPCNGAGWQPGRPRSWMAAASRPRSPASSNSSSVVSGVPDGSSRGRGCQMRRRKRINLGRGYE